MTDDRTSTYSRAPASAERTLVALLPSGVETWALPRRGTVTIGRDPTCDVVIDHPSVSRKHAELEIDDRVLVRNAASLHGVKVDGLSIGDREVAELGVGAVGELGEITFLLQRRHGDWPACDASTVVSIGEHEALVGGTLARLVDLIRRVAHGDLTVLVTGETGVGKDLVAELVHRASSYARGPFVSVHCAALPSALFESELFGHERGAFTGATRDKIGLVESAHGGTLFLDEVGEIPMAVQVKLLRVLEDRRVTRVGGTTSKVADVRFVAATNRDLDREVAEGRFREDLYYRLCGLTLAVPPLRERTDEIVPIAESFLKRFAADRPLVFGASALAALAAHSFPGNVRELRLAVQRAAALATGPEIQASDLCLDAAADAHGADDAALVAALDEAAGNQTDAARRLGISRRTLVSRLATLRGRSI